MKKHHNHPYFLDVYGMLFLEMFLTAYVKGTMPQNLIPTFGLKLALGLEGVALSKLIKS